MTKKKISKSKFIIKLEKQWQAGKFLCVGLDTEYAKLPKSIISSKFISPSSQIFQFNKKIINATQDLVCAYKPNSAFYEALGEEGRKALKLTVRYIKNNFPDILVILDAKRADIGNTNLGYIKSAFEEIEVDAITIHPYLGQEAIKPFLDQKDKGIIILAKTSNPGAGEFQDLLVGTKKTPLYQHIAKQVAASWNNNGNCGVVVGATYPNELLEVRKIIGNIPILIPGIGIQGGEIKATVQVGKDSRGWGMIINVSRSVIFASNGADFAQAARKVALNYSETINQALRLAAQ